MCQVNGLEAFNGESAPMSKKHFEALAEAIASIGDEKARDEAALAVASVCSEFNSNFNRGRFLRACGVVRE